MRMGSVRMQRGRADEERQRRLRLLLQRWQSTRATEQGAAHAVQREGGVVRVRWCCSGGSDCCWCCCWRLCSASALRSPFKAAAAAAAIEPTTRSQLHSHQAHSHSADSRTSPCLDRAPRSLALHSSSLSAQLHTQLSFSRRIAHQPR